MDVSQTISKSRVKELKYFLIHVGTNDLENKHYLQVLDELKQVLNDVCNRFPGMKLIVSELLPRNDTKDDEVKCFNTVLKSYAGRHTDINIANQHNMRDPQFTMFYNEKQVLIAPGRTFAP